MIIKSAVVPSVLPLVNIRIVQEPEISAPEQDVVINNTPEVTPTAVV